MSVFGVRKEFLDVNMPKKGPLVQALNIYHYKTLMYVKFGQVAFSS